MDQNDQENKRIIANSSLVLQLDIESSLPASIFVDFLQVALRYTESKLPESPPALVPSKRKAGVVNRSPSTRSDVSVKSNISNDVTTKDEPEETDNTWADRLRLCEVTDVKQDGTLSAVRTVCRNSAHVLRRKDSTGSFLSSGSTTTVGGTTERADYKTSFSVGSLTLNPGKNRVYLKTVVGNGVGTYTLEQMSMSCFDGKLEMLGDLSWLSHSLRSFVVTSETPTVVLNQPNPLEPLWAGIEQKVNLSLYSGSISFPKVGFGCQSWCKLTTL